MWGQQPQQLQQPESGGRAALRVLAVVFLPWSTARFLLKPAVGPHPRDRLLDRLGFWRAAVGLAVVVLASIRWISPLAVVENIQEKAGLTALYALIAVPLVFLVLLGATRSAYRRAFVTRIPRLLRRVGTGIASYCVPVGFFFATMGFFVLLSGSSGKITGGRVLVAIAAIPGIFLGAAWCAVFFACTTYWAARTSFWLSEMHPLMAPVGSVVLMLVVTARETYLWETNGLPSPLWLGLNICGVISTLVLAFYEYRHLRASGYRFREGPNPIHQATGRNVTVTKQIR